MLTIFCNPIFIECHIHIFWGPPFQTFAFVYKKIVMCDFFNWLAGGRQSSFECLASDVTFNFIFRGHTEALSELNGP